MKDIGHVVRGMGTGFALALCAGCLLGGAGRPGPVRISAGPGESLAAVRDRVRAIPASNRVDGVVVTLAPGAYFLPEGLDFTAADGGATNAAPVVWRAAAAGTVTLTGACGVPAARFRKVTDPALLARLPEEGRGRVWAADVADLLPGTVPQLARSFGGTPAPPMVFMGGTFATLAKWPNGSAWAGFTKRVDRGLRLSRQVYPGNYRNGAFVWDDPRAKRWDFAAGVWLNGYWTHDWCNHSIKAGSWGAENGTNAVLRLDGDMAYGVMAGTWGRKDRRFRAFNLFEELDEPGEWWLDRTRKILYIVPPDGVAPRVADDVRLALSARELVRGRNVRNLRFENLAFAYNYGTLAAFAGGADVTFANCRFANTARTGAALNGFRHALEGCEIVHCGGSGCSVGGGDRKKLVRADVRVENCRIHDFGVFQRTYAPGVGVSGCGVTLRGNEIWDAPHAAVLYGGNEHLFEFNDVHHVLLETGDAGAFYTGRDWTTMGNVLRYNFVHELGAQGKEANTMGFYFDDCDCGDAVFGNVFWKVARGIMIGGGREHPVRNNIFADCQIGLSIDNRGMNWKSWNTPDNGWNLQEKAERMGYRSEPWASRYPRLAKILEDSPREPLYNPVEENVFMNCTKGLLALSGKGMDAVIPKLTVRGNLVYAPQASAKGAGGRAGAAPDARIAAGFAVQAAGTDPGFVDAAHGDFRLKGDAPVAAALPALRRLPLGRICRREP